MRLTRVFHSDNGTLTDFTNELHKYRSQTASLTFVAAEDYLYIGNIAPFNHFFVKMATANTASTAMTLEYWGGSTWSAVAELDDQTDGLTKDGFVSWVPDRNSGWTRQDTEAKVTGLETLNIYDRYWARVKFDNDLDDPTVIQWLGQKFSDDEDLNAEYPDLVRSNVKTAFETGKVDWEEQHVKAAEIIIQDLIRKKVIYTKNQVLERETYRLASAALVAHIVYNTFGDDFVDQANSARNEYKERMSKSVFDVDLDGDAELDRREVSTRQGFMFR